MSHEIVELTAGLASRVNNLAVMETGDACRTLLEQQEELQKLALAAIVRDLKEEDKAYRDAVAGLKKAIDEIGAADKKIDDVQQAIKLTARAINLVAKVVKLVV